MILNVLVVEAEGLEAKDANGFREGGDGRGLFSFEVVKEFFINEKEKVNFPFCWEISFYSLYTSWEETTVIF